MLSNRMAASDINDNDKLMVALAYVFTPLVPIIILLVDSMKIRPFQKYHAVQSLGLGVVVYVLATIISAVTFGFGCLCIWVFFIPQLYYAYVGYQGNYFEIPMLTNFMVQQGWMQRPGGGGPTMS